MHGLNSSYGHRAILASVADVPDERPIWGFLQHGWTPFDGWPANSHLPARWPRFVWSSRMLDRSLPGRSPAPYRVVGSPFAHLLAGSGHRLQPTPGSATLYFPQHSSETASVVGDHGRLADELRQHENAEVRVCLYWLDAAKPDIAEAYSARGIEVVSVGATRNDRFYLPKWLRLLDGVGRVASNRVSTAVLYGAALGLDAVVYGEVMGTLGAQEDVAPRADSGRALVPGAGPDSAELRISSGWARAELGFAELLSGTELRRVLGWSGIRGLSGGAAQGALDVVRWARSGPAAQSRGPRSPRQ